MLTVNDVEYWILIWIIIELAILTFVIRKNTTRWINPNILSAIGLSLVVFGTMTYLVFGALIFTLNETSTICAYSAITTKPDIDDEKLLKCYTDGIETKWNLFYGSIIVSMIIVIGNILNFTRRK